MRPSSAHSDAAPSPARAEPHDATAWLPLPEPDSLPTVEHLLAGDDAGAVPAEARDAAAGAREVAAPPSPARAAPHDEAAWLPLPDLGELPEVHELIDPAAAVEAPVRRDVPVGLPSPARAEPHDPASWLPVPDVHGLTPEGDGPDDATPPTRRVHLPRIPVRAMFIAVVVAALLGGAAYGATRIVDPGDDVELRVDGDVVARETGVSTVGSFLKEEHVTLGEHDRVDPDLDAPIENNMTVKVVRAFPVTVDFDGTTSTMFTTRSQPAAFLLDAFPEQSVAIRNAPKVVTPDATLQVRTAKSGVLRVDNQLVQYENVPVHTVRELLDNYDVVLGPEDVTSPIAVTDVLPDEQVIAVKRVAGHTRVEVVPYSVPDQVLDDPNLGVGETSIRDAVDGLMRITYAQTYSNDVLVDEIAVSKVPAVVAQPRITFHGTKADPRWDRIAECETGGNWAAQGPTYQGGLGIYYKNWLHYRDKNMPMNAGDATREQQIIVAIRIKNEHGWRAWGCGKTLGYSGKN
jgi:uncharacterized protein YabE (DUF348 family)